MNELKHIAEFRSALEHYKLSPSAKTTLEATKLVLLVGPTSSGRNTVINELLKRGDYHYIVSDTTREPRVKDGKPIEQNGREYWFRHEDDVLADIKAGDFLEAAIIHGQQVSGISIREIKRAHAAGLIAITDVEPVGAATIHQLKPDTITIFVVPPDFDTWLTRLHRRSDLPEDEVRRRLETACSEIEAALENDYYTFVVNDTLGDATHDVDAIAKTGSAAAEDQQHARKVVEALHEAALDYLRRQS